MVARRAHNPKVASSNLVSATRGRFSSILGLVYKKIDRQCDYVYDSTILKIESIYTRNSVG